MARAKTKAAVDEVQVPSPEADVHHMTRRIGERSGDGVITVDEADAHIRAWLQAGYKLKFVQSLGLEPGVVDILYILVKE